MRGHLALRLAIGLAVLAACTGSDDATNSTAAAPTTAALAPAERLGVVDLPCDERTPITSASGLTEVEAVATDATVYGLVFLTHPAPIVDGDEVKVVWRMTGEGDVHVASEAPSGRAGTLTFGPEYHPSSSYDRPGMEWGTGFLFDEPGCWHIHLERDIGQGDVWFDVAQAPG
ncbi:MAG: hypothetical protein AB7L17_04830 [Ilumatobacteraceae bacterium]